MTPLRPFTTPHDTFMTFTMPLRPLRPTDVTLRCLVCDGGGLHLSGRSGNNGTSNDPARLLLHDTSCLLPRKFVSCLRSFTLKMLISFNCSLLHVIHDGVNPEFSSIMYFLYNFVSDPYFPRLSLLLIEVGCR